MSKLIRHKWVEQPGFRVHKCSTCGCVRYWDAEYQRLMFKWKGLVGYTPPSCDLPNVKPSNVPYFETINN